MIKKVFITGIILMLFTSIIFGADVKLQYRDGDHGNFSDNHIKPHLIIINQGVEDVPMNEFTIRYYYTKDGTAAETFYIDYALVGNGNITGTFQNGYIEMGFTQGAGTLYGGSTSGEIQSRFHKNDWSNYDETDDYSYKNPAASYADWDRVTLYRNGVLVWGIEPGGATEQTTPGPTPVPDPTTPGPTPVPDTPTPEPGSTIFVESDGMVVVETENYTGSAPGTGIARKHYWKEESGYYDSSNGMALKASPNYRVNTRDTTDGPRLDYDAYFTTTGTYYFWVRMWGPGGSNNSVHGGIDGIPASYGKTGISVTSYRWKWIDKVVDRVTVNVDTPGVHTINIWMREDGTRIDKIMLTTDAGYTPAGRGPAESPLEPLPTPEPAQDIGDVNGDGIINIIDALLIAQGYVGLNPSGFDTECADVNYDGTIDIVDALLIAQYYVGVIQELPGPDPTPAVTPLPPPEPGAGDVWIMPASQTVNTGPFITEIHVNTGTQKVAGAGIILNYDESIIDVDIATGTSGVETGPDGMGFTVNATTPGEIIISGLEPLGIGPGTDIIMCTVHWNALQMGTTQITMSVQDLIDENTYTVGNPNGTGCEVTVSEPLPTPDPSPVPHPDAGAVWVVPPDLTVDVGDEFVTEIHVNSGTQKLAAYGIDIIYDPVVISIDDMIAGPDGFVSATSGSDPGLIIASGFDTQGTGPGEDLHLLTLYWTAAGGGTTLLELIINDLVDDNINIIGTPHGINGQVTVAGPEMTPTPTPTPTVIPTPTATPTLSPDYPPGTGDVWVVPASLSVSVEEHFTTEIHVNSGNQRVAAYGIECLYDPAVMGVNTSIGTSGIEPGAQGFVAAVGTADPGMFIISGFDASGTGPGQDLHLVTINWIAMGEGTSSLTLVVDTLADETTNTIGNPNGTAGSVTVLGTVTSAGNVWIVPSTLSVSAGSEFETEIHVDSGNQRIAAYGIDVSYDPGVIEINSDPGVEAGADGYVAAYSGGAGLVVISGFDVSGTGPGSDLHLLTIYWIAVSDGSTALTLVVDTLADPDTSTVGNPSGIDGYVSVGTGQIVTPTPTVDGTPIPTVVPTPTPTVVPTPTAIPTLSPEDPPGTGDVWMVPADIAVDEGAQFETTIYINSGNQKVAAYGFELQFDPEVVQVNTDLGKSGLLEGPYGYIVAVNPDNPGELKFAGYDNFGTGPGAELEFLTVFWISVGGGSTYIDLIVNSLADPNTTTIGIPNGTGSQLTVTATTPIPDPDPTPDPTSTPEPVEGAGNVWFEPSDQTVNAGDLFTTELHINSGTQVVASYGMKIHFDYNVVEVNGEIGVQGIETGPDGFLTGVNISTPGEILLSGADYGTGPGVDLHFLTIHWIASGAGTTQLDITIEHLAEYDYYAGDIGTPNGIDGSVTVIPPE